VRVVVGPDGDDAGAVPGAIVVLEPQGDFVDTTTAPGGISP
jgi:hypothetical protein